MSETREVVGRLRHAYTGWWVLLPFFFFEDNDVGLLCFGMACTDERTDDERLLGLLLDEWVACWDYLIGALRLLESLDWTGQRHGVLLKGLLA